MYKYKGDGFIIGIPARDISDEEFNKMNKEQQEQIKNSPWYELDKPIEKKPSLKRTQEA